MGRNSLISLTSQPKQQIDTKKLKMSQLLTYEYKYELLTVRVAYPYFQLGSNECL
jgi:hypothetical protein